MPTIIASHRSKAEMPADGNAMPVDVDNSIPALAIYLALCATYPTSPPTLRLGIRQHVSDARDLVCILEILEGWIDAWNDTPVQLLPDRVTKDERGVHIPLYTNAIAKGDLPPLDKVVYFFRRTSHYHPARHMEN